MLPVPWKPRALYRTVPRTDLQTHEVKNQPPPFADVNIFTGDVALRESIEQGAASRHVGSLADFGARCGSAEVREWARLANTNIPQLKSFDRYGQRLDEVEFHPAYHQLMNLGLSAGYAASAWNGEHAGHTKHAALTFMMAATDAGVGCPMTMTYAAIPALRHAPAVLREWEPRITSAHYDSRFIPASQKNGVTIGMAITEKQGGSDVRANTTRAIPIGGDAFELVGHKWFCSAPMCDAFLTLAKTDTGATCFLVPRWRPDGTRNPFHIMRLKDKLGDRSNASSEIEYHHTYAEKVGEEGRGIRTIIEMVQHTRLDCVAGSAGGMRAAVAEALWHCAHRSAFAKHLVDQPAMAAVLADLVLESEAATALAFRLARAFDRAASDEAEAAFLRLATPIAKYWVCKRQPAVVYEALECHGGAGFVEEGPMPRLFRQSPLNAIWEGSGNVIALDVLRALQREPKSLAMIYAEIGKARHAHTYLDHHAKRLDKWLKPKALHEGNARAFVEDLALAMQATALHQSAPTRIFDGFCRTRLDHEGRSLLFGSLPATIDTRRIINRAMPH